MYTVDRRAAHPLSQRELDAHESDLANFDSMIVYADWRFREVRRQERERYGEGPTRLKLAVAADLLKKLMKGMGSYAHVVGELVDELLSSVIVDYAKHAKPKMKVGATRARHYSYPLHPSIHPSICSCRALANLSPPTPILAERLPETR